MGGSVTVCGRVLCVRYIGGAAAAPESRERPTPGHFTHTRLGREGAGPYLRPHVTRRGQQESEGTVGRAGVPEGGADMQRNAWQPISKTWALYFLAPTILFKRRCTWTSVLRRTSATSPPYSEPLSPRRHEHTPSPSPHSPDVSPRVLEGLWAVGLTKGQQQRVLCVCV